MNPLRALAPIALSTLLVGLSIACTAARSGIELQSASDARLVALDREAPELAPYEWHMANHYLRKAWEEAGHGEHKTSVQLARKAQEWTDQALVQIGRGPRRLDVEVAPIEERLQSMPRPLPQPDVPDPMPNPLDSDDDLQMDPQ
jgi:hypothetical protein